MAKAAVAGKAAAAVAVGKGVAAAIENPSQATTRKKPNLYASGADKHIS